MGIGINFMKTLSFLLLLAFIINFNAFAGTCSSISYTSSTANSTLTSTKYNTDNSTVYNFVNAYDAGCISSQTLEADSLDQTVATGFAAPLNGVFDGCKVTRDSAATLLIGECIASVNNNWIKTATGTAVAWSDLDTGAEAASTFYYVYIDSLSDGATLTPVVSVTPPGTNGMNGSDRVLARFYNDGSSDIIETVSQWQVNKFESYRIRAIYETSAGQTIDNNSIEIVDFGTKVKDNYSAVTVGSSWKFTAPIADYYDIKAFGYFNSAFDAGELVTGNIYKNGTYHRRTSAVEAHAGVTALMAANASVTVWLESGDYINFQIFQNSGGGIALNNEVETTWITIESQE